MSPFPASGGPRPALDLQRLDRAGAEAALVAAALAGNDERVDAILERFPGLAVGSVACALVLADPVAAESLSSASVNAAVGANRWPPLLTLCSSRYRVRDPEVRAMRLDLARTLLKTALDCVLGVEDRAAQDKLARVLGEAARSPRDTEDDENRYPGIGCWPAFSDQASPRGQTAPYDAPDLAAAFERAADAVVAGDVDSLRVRLHERPELATARSSRPHRCTLLHYLAANGVEGERQKTPANAVEVIDLLLAAGSDPNASCYTCRGGPGQTAAGLLAGSAPPREARLTVPMIAALARGGARLDEVYTLLVRLFAGERVDLAAAVAGRALVESVTLGEPALVSALLNAGVGVNSRRGDGATALHLAAFDGDGAVIEELLARGADRSLRDNVFRGTVFHGTPAGWAHAGGHAELGNRLAERPGSRRR